MIQLFVSELVTPCIGFQYSNTISYLVPWLLFLLPVLAKNRMLGSTARKQANRLSKYEVYSEGGRNKRLVRRLRLFLFVAIGAAMMGGLSAIVYNQATSTFSVCYYSYIKNVWPQNLFKLNVHALLFISQHQHFSAAVSQLLWVRVVINMLDIIVVDTSFKTRRLMGELSTFKSKEMERSWVTAPAMV